MQAERWLAMASHIEKRGRHTYIQTERERKRMIFRSVTFAQELARCIEQSAVAVRAKACNS